MSSSSASASSVAASGSASGTVAPVTPILDGEGPVSEGVTLLQQFDISRITTLEAENLTIQLRMDNLTLLVQEQAEWLRRQSLLLSSQRQLLEALAGEGDTMRDRLRTAEDRVTLLMLAQPDVHQADDGEDDDEDEDEVMN